MTYFLMGVFVGAGLVAAGTLLSLHSTYLLLRKIASIEITDERGERE
jgi:hypothetical protein